MSGEWSENGEMMGWYNFVEESIFLFVEVDGRRESEVFVYYSAVLIHAHFYLPLGLNLVFA